MRDHLGGVMQRTGRQPRRVAGDFLNRLGTERDEVRIGDQDKPAPRALRVTQIFRKEKGEWKLLHRHADPLVEKKAPSAVSEK